MAFGLLHLFANGAGRGENAPEGLESRPLEASSKFGKRKTIMIQRYGDLLGDTVLSMYLNPPEIPNGYRFEWVECVGLRIIKSIKLIIGGSTVWETSGALEHTLSSLGKISTNNLKLVEADNKKISVVYFPFRFLNSATTSTTNTDNIRLPLIALLYHQVSIDIEYEALHKCCRVFDTNNKLLNINEFNKLELDTTIEADLIVKYHFLDSDPRRELAQNRHEYRIHQNLHQRLTFKNVEAQKKLNCAIRLEGNTKALFWVVRDASEIKEKKYWVDELVDNNPDYRVPNELLDIIGTYCGVVEKKYKNNWVGNTNELISGVRFSVNGTNTDELSMDYYSRFTPLQIFGKINQNPNVGMTMFSSRLDETGGINLNYISNFFVELFSAVDSTKLVVDFYTITEVTLCFAYGMGAISHIEHNRNEDVDDGEDVEYEENDELVNEEIEIGEINYQTTPTIATLYKKIE